MSHKPHTKLPLIALSILNNHKAWLVGSGAAWYVGDSKKLPRDFDIIVPPPEWNAMCRLIKPATIIRVTLNSFGGLKLWYTAARSIDVWPSYLDDFLPADGPQVAIRLNPRTIIRSR